MPLKEDDQLALLKEALWCSIWGLTFSVVALIGEVIAAIQLFQGNSQVFLKVYGISAVPMGIGWYLRYKSKQYRRRANNSN